MPNILVTGANGQLGRELQELSSKYDKYNFFFTCKEDLDIIDAPAIELFVDINAINTIPLAMEIKDENVSALDANGNVIKDIDVTVTGTITESKDGKTEVASSLTINLNETAEGAISKLDGLKLKVTAVPGQATDVQLLSSQWMQLKDMKLKIPNGIKVDLN